MANLELGNGYKDILFDALEFNNYLNQGDESFHERNEKLEADLGNRDDDTLHCDESNISQYIDVLLENFMNLQITVLEQQVLISNLKSVNSDSEEGK